MRSKNVSNYDVLSDRIKSLVERWDKAYESGKVPSDMAMKGLMSEINDDFTKYIVEENS